MAKKPEAKIVKGYSRYGEPRYETYLGNGAYLLEGPSKFTRYALASPNEVFYMGIMPDDISMVDFEGGPDFSITQTYYPGPDRKKTKHRLEITKLEVQTHTEKDWTAVIIYTQELGT